MEPESENVIGREGYVIPKHRLSYEDAQKIGSELVFMPVVDEAYGRPKPVRLVKDLGTRVAIPPAYGVDNFGPAPERFDVTPAALRFGGTLDDRLDQPAIVDGAVQQLREKGAGILAQHTGAGKTVCALAVAAALGLKTLVIVHKAILMEQWIERIGQFLPEARVGVVQSDQCESAGRDIVVGMLQSLGQRDYDGLDDHGLLIFDECFPARQRVLTTDGPVEIGAIHDALTLELAVPDAVSFDPATGEVAAKAITRSWVRPFKPVVKVKYGRHVCVCTPDHRFLTADGYVRAQHLKRGQMLVALPDGVKRRDVAVDSVHPHTIGPEPLYDIEVADTHNFVLCDRLGRPNCVVSNCHHAPAAVFSQVFYKVNAPYKLGLSATPERKDGLTKVLTMLLGDVFYRLERRNQNHVRVWTVRTRREHPITLNRAGKPCMVSLINTIVADRTRNDLLVDVVRRLAGEGRSVLLLSDRREHSREMYARLEATDECRLFLGGQSRKQLQVPLTERLIFSTYPLASEGLDVSHIDTLVMATPKSNVVQICGRILRARNTQKHQPLIVDFVDGSGVTMAQYNKRCVYYRSCGFQL